MSKKDYLKGRKMQDNVVVDDVIVAIGRNHHGNGCSNFVGRAAFRSVGQLQHYFNLVANPGNQTFDVPEFDLNGISCINEEVMHFHNKTAAEQFIEVLKAQEAANIEMYG